MTRHVPSALALALLLPAAMLAACGGEGGGGGGITDPDPVPAVLEAMSVLQQAGYAGAPAADAPAVRVKDAAGRGVRGVRVNFAVTSGGGHLSHAQVTTDGAGAAYLETWILGQELGNNAVSASVPGLTPLVFQADARDPCVPQPAYVLFTQRTATLGTPPCRVDRGWGHYHPVTMTTPQAVTFTQRSTVLDPYLFLESPTGQLLAFNDDDDFSLNSAIDVIAPAGSYRLLATSYNPGQTGAYTLGSATLSRLPGCHFTWVIPGIQTAQALATTDCTNEGSYGDLYLMMLKASQTVRVSMVSSQLDALLLLGNESGLAAENDDGGGGTDALITYTAPRDGLYMIVATSAGVAETGAYTLSVTAAAAGAGGGSSLRAPSSRDARFSAAVGTTLERLERRTTVKR
jgi:hypothetical protein